MSQEEVVHRYRRRPTAMPNRWSRSAIGRLLVVAAVSLGLIAPWTATPPAAASSSEWLEAEQTFVALLNQERSNADLPTVRVNLQMLRIARDWSEQMANRGQMSHRPDLPSSVNGPWERLGENVGRTTHAPGDRLSASAERLHRAFMDSPPHRANVLGDYDQVGVGVVVGPSGTLWVTFNFLQGPIGAFPLFADLSANAHRDTIERAWIGGLVRGCSFDRYCVRGLVTRAQMATFIARALGLQPVSTSRFQDVDPRSAHAGAIGALVDAGIVRGCSDDRYCPDQAVDRAQMATFLARALQLAPRSMAEFADVLPTSPHFGNVNAVAVQAVTAGCDATGMRYCPGELVRRDQMASFLSRAFDAPVSFWQTDPAPTGASDAPSAGEAHVGTSLTHERRSPHGVQAAG